MIDIIIKELEAEVHVNEMDNRFCDSRCRFKSISLFHETVCCLLFGSYLNFVQGEGHLRTRRCVLVEKKQRTLEEQKHANTD